MNILRTLALIAGLDCALGCTHHSLSRNTVQTTGTVMEIQYRSALANLALMSSHPETLPNHVHLADGVVQITDRAGFGQSGGLTTFGGADFGIERFGPSGQRQISEQWGTDATTDPERLYDLQSLYRVALGLQPLAPPNAIAYLRRNLPSADDKDTQGDGRRVPLDVLAADVPPPGWYGVGDKHDVPKDACYVGRWGDRFAWVTADGVPHLARFTATVLLVIKLKPGERGGGKSGLAVSAGN